VPKINVSKYDLEVTDSDWKRFWSKVQKTETCWNWTGHTSPHGYGKFTKYGHNLAAHRWLYHNTIERVLEDKVVDHICRNRLCVNPKHLRPLSDTENVLLGVGASATNRRKTHCIKGHEFTPDNTEKVMVSHRGPYRRCLKCKNKNENLVILNRLKNKRLRILKKLAAVEEQIRLRGEE